MSSNTDEAVTPYHETASESQKAGESKTGGSSTPGSLSNRLFSTPMGEKSSSLIDGSSPAEAVSRENPDSKLSAREKTLNVNERDTGSMTPTETNEAVKRQYEAKLKDVMEKARDHAKKLANERDEARRQSDDKEAKVNQFRQLMNRATGELESKETRIRELEQQMELSTSKVEKVEEQMRKMEEHFTKPGEGEVDYVLSVSDTSGVEWVLTSGSRWWRREQLPHSGDTRSSPHLDFSMLKKHAAEMREMESQLHARALEFQEYRKKVEIVLNERTTPILPDSEIGLRDTKRIMKLEEDLAQSLVCNESLRKRISELQTVENKLVRELNSAKAESRRGLGPLEEMESALKISESEKTALIEKLTFSKSQVTELSKQLEIARTAAYSSAAKFVPKEIDSSASTPPNEISQLTRRSLSVQTDSLGSIFRSFSKDLSPAMAERPAAPLIPSHNVQHDYVAIPLRNQIRQLMEDLETERGNHAETLEALRKVEEDLQNREAEKKLASDLSDPVKVEYMRNVARRFVVLAPWVKGSDEFEQLVPVILNFFGLEGAEAIKLMKERKKHASSRY